MKTIQFNFYDTKYELAFYIGKYANNGRLAIEIECMSGTQPIEPFSDLTINIPMYMFETDNEIIIDNDCPMELIEQLEDIGILNNTYKTAQSGFATYMVMQIDLEKAKEYACAIDN